MEPWFKLNKESSSPPIDATKYRSLIGSLRYLVHTRPDIAFSIRNVSRFMESLSTEHLATVKRVLMYLAGTLDFGCRFARMTDEPWLIGHSDSNMDTHKSMTGVLFFFGPSQVSLQSQKQKVVALSSCEAEYIAVALAACQGFWLTPLLSVLKDEEPQPVELRVDNKSAI
ncbi:secreted RxLR effector protein 161-like [Phragmites australis]|uniref:secreted RxLR effector protein 161-like n=1 Tax=Phragmites australis TaxID=29695 RepID=UPI002D79025D|nr:secreted RxLR effector protein 161-like [Phragmites australis]